MRDLADELGLNEASEDQQIVIPIGGRDWHFHSNVNSFALASLAGGGVRGIVDFLETSVIAEEANDFRKTLLGFASLDEEKFLALIGRIVEIVTERPTGSPSASRPTATKRTSGPKSKAGSSSARGRAAAR